MLQTLTGRRTLAVALLALTSAIAQPAFAQEEQDSSVDPAGASSGIASRHGNRPQKKKTEEAAKPARYPNTTRQAPKQHASAKGVKALNAMLDAYNGGKLPEAKAAADAILADAASNDYEKAFAARIAAQVAIQAKDMPAALRYTQQAIDANALDNDDHLDQLLLKAQLQMQQQDYANALASADAFIAQAGASPASALVIRGNALYRLNRYPEAVTALRQALALEPNHPDWQALLADALTKSGNLEEAKKVAESVAAADPGNAAARFNLVQTYVDAKQYDRAAELLEKMRAAGQLDEGGYQQLFTAYANSQGKEEQTIQVINEGLGKGLLKPSYNLYIALAQSYYFSDNVPKAIENYKQASALAKDGQVDLTLAKIYLNEQRISDAKAAARTALSRGLKNPAEANRILALPGK